MPTIAWAVPPASARIRFSLSRGTPAAIFLPLCGSRRTPITTSAARPASMGQPVQCRRHAAARAGHGPDGLGRRRHRPQLRPRGSETRRPTGCTGDPREHQAGLVTLAARSAPTLGGRARRPAKVRSPLANSAMPSPAAGPIPSEPWLRLARRLRRRQVAVRFTVNLGKVG